MKKLFFVLFILALSPILTTSQVLALSYTATSGDRDYGADRNSSDVASNMDFYVFPVDANMTGAATNSKGKVAWSYELPFSILTATSGSMTVRAWDIDSDVTGANRETIGVYFNFGTQRVYAGELTGKDGGSMLDWENAVIDGTTASLPGWSTSTYAFSTALLTALSGSTGFILELDVQNTSEIKWWAAVIDFATIKLDYKPGESNPNVNPVPEPATILLTGIGLAGLAGLGRKKLNN